MATGPRVSQPFALVPEHSFEEKWELAQRRYVKTIRTFARNCVNQLPGFDLDDVEQEMLVVLWRCVLNYDPNKGGSFNTLFQGSARNRCITLIRTASTKSRTGVNVSLDVEAVAQAVDEAFNEMSTEDRCMFREEIREMVAEHGADAIFNGLRGRPRARKAS